MSHHNIIQELETTVNELNRTLEKIRKSGMIIYFEAPRLGSLEKNHDITFEVFAKIELVK